MKKLKKMLDAWADGKQVRGVQVSLADIYMLMDIYNALCRKERFEFINGNAKSVLDKCGISVKERGIGWVVNG